jgi:hypothetical protein
MRASSEILEDLLKSLEDMIDAQDDMWQEEKYHNHKQLIQIQEERLVPAKREFKKHLDDYIDRRFQTYIDKYGITKVK